jgi:enoyl-CoA hydratase
MSDSVLVKQDGEVIDITLDAAGGNQVSEDMGRILAETFLHAPGSAKLIRLTSKGPDFCLGRKSPPLDRATATAATFRDVVASGPLRLYDAFKACPLPIIGLVQGRAFGVGCAIAGLCDLTIAADDATFCVPEMDHGIPPTLVMSALLDRLSYKDLAYLVYSRGPITALEAKAIGLVSQIVRPSELNVEGQTLVEKMTSCTALALRGVKEFMLAAPRTDPRTRDVLASTLIATILSSQHR